MVVGSKGGGDGVDSSEKSEVLTEKMWQNSQRNLYR